MESKETTYNQWNEQINCTLGFIDNPLGSTHADSGAGSAVGRMSETAHGSQPTIYAGMPSSGFAFSSLSNSFHKYN